MKKVTKTYKVWAVFLLLLELVVLGMVASGDFEFQYGIIGLIVSLIFTGWCIKILISPTYKMTSVDDPELRENVFLAMEEHGKGKSNKENQLNLRFGSSIPDEWISAGIKKFAKKIAPYEKVVMFFDTATFKPGKKEII